MKKASFWKTLKDGRVMCLLCPNHCILKDHQCGICLSRVNLNGVLYTRNYGEITIMRKDTMNQRLLYFKPDIKTISIGSWGCNLACSWCYNWEISRYRPDHLIKKISPVALARMLNDTKAIVFTYNEPITWYEYIMDVCKLLPQDVDIILNTNAYAEREPWRELLNYVTALNVDLKAFSPFKYAIGPKGHFESVLVALEECVKRGKHVEVTFTLIEGFNDDLEEFKKLVMYISSLDGNIPLHIRRGYPAFKYEKGPVSLSTLKLFKTIALKYLRRVEIVL